MGLHYEGDIKEDIFEVLGNTYTPMLMYICSNVGYGGAQQIAICNKVFAGGDVFLPQIRLIVAEIGIFKFCRHVQVLWAAIANGRGQPTSIAHDATYDPRYQHLLPPRV